MIYMCYYVMKDIVLFGMPGAGKGTQAELFLEASDDRYIHLSTGDVFRSLMSRSNAIGDLIKARVSSGGLVDDRVTISIFDAYFFSVLSEDDSYMLLDGYPRSIPQLEAFLDQSRINNRDLVGLYFELPEEVAIERMMARGRDGETKEVIQKRLDEYYHTTQPIVDAFAAKEQLIAIDASAGIEDIHKEVMRALGQ